MQSTQAWAETEFGQAVLGDRRRSRRLVLVAAEVARSPAGTVMDACASSASREGAFRFLENRAVRADAIQTAMGVAAAGRCREHTTVFVPIDATSLTVTDRQRAKGVGAVGSWAHGSRGVHVMTALAVAQDGSPLGICAQDMWVREQRTPHARKYRRAGYASESDEWTKVLLDAHSTFREHAPACAPWFQMDRGADCWHVLAMAHERDMLVTVRANHDRRLDGDVGSLWSTMRQSRVVATKRIELPDGQAKRRNQCIGGGRRRMVRTPPRQARIAHVEIRAATVPLVLTMLTGRTFTVPFNAVLVTERRRGDDRIEWLLLTTHPIKTRRDVQRVVHGYTMRWKIEELHRTWKRGLCRVEDTQLRSRDAICKWATILAAVATRALRLTKLARSTPDVPATTELSRYELDALFALREPKGFDRHSVPTLGQAVRWIADIGGYAGPWNGPPGPTVIGRGLYDVLVTARAFENRDKKR